jgi:hypothetical protein
MHRVNVMLEEEQVRALKERARQKRTSVSALLRDLIDQDRGLREASALARRPSILDLVGVVEGPGDEGARRHDEILYGKP